MNLAHTAWKHRELVGNLVSRELKIRYRGSALGFLWSVLIPLFMALIYVFFLRLLAGRGVPTGEIIIGVFAWQFTVQCVNSGLTSITGSTNLVKKVYFPRILLPLSGTLANLITYALSLLVQLPFVWILQHVQGLSVSPLTMALPLAIAVQLVFNFALTLLLASVNVYYRDAQHLVGVALSAWFFVSPVMYNLSFVENMAQHHPWVMPVMMLNPMAVIVTAYRALMLPDVAFPWQPAVWVSLTLVALLMVYSYRLFQRLEKYFADML
jgi:ABC-type polysaccharide/polyol phosphate export permease